MKKTYSKTTGATILLQIDQAATNAAIQAALAKLEPLPKLTSPAVDADDEAKAKHQASLMAQMQVQGKRDAQVREQVGSVYYPNDEVRDDAPPAGFDPSTDTIDGFGHSWVVGKEARTAQRKAANDAAAVAVVKARRQALLAETDPIANLLRSPPRR
jgi:hypothetical protein